MNWRHSQNARQSSRLLSLCTCPQTRKLVLRTQWYCPHWKTVHSANIFLLLVLRQTLINCKKSMILAFNLQLTYSSGPIRMQCLKTGTIITANFHWSLRMCSTVLGSLYSLHVIHGRWVFVFNLFHYIIMFLNWKKNNGARFCVIFRF